MSIERLNAILAKLAEAPSRELVLEFSSALVEWMGLKATENNGVPRLISPQTMKLKDYLAVVPRTVQPQLYRLSAENQNIRVRFAVLKKLKKDYVSQLVDNDPGIGSYQAITKNLDLGNGKTKFIPSQPYFIHFVATPEYDRVVLIFNQGEQKRIITFRGRLTHTQHNKIIEQWRDIASKSKPEISSILWKSLDIREVNKEFYAQIKRRFDSLVSIIGTQKSELAEILVKQFAVRMIGRYLFCWFLKEKEIIPSKLISSKMINETDDFYRSILLKLFFDTLNTKIQDRTALLSNDERFEKIPYLNGGLFDESDDDRLFRDLALDEWLADFVSVLENYDFTVDESSSRYQQVSVDPEMLGRIFENLLASQNPETQEAANNERKAFGAFYTPREIVDFMVDESLRAYLANELQVKPDELDPAFAANPSWPEKLKDKKLDADTALRTVKVLDPACGSGAFPMGVLHGLISLRELTGFQPDTYKLKKEILSENIYGVDIMPMAVEIARLRAWLSLIVEEDYKPDKPPSTNYGIDALPNLDFKFMQGNSLLETFEGVKIFDKTILERQALTKTEQLIEQTKKKLDSLQRQYMELHSQDKLKGTEKSILDKELKENNALLKKILKTSEQVEDYGLFDGGENILAIREKLKNAQDDFFKESDRERKGRLKDEIETLIWGLIRTSLKGQDKTDKLKDIEKFKKQNYKPFFFFELYFPDVFEKNNGFDIIISNPPYVQIQTLSGTPEQKELEIQNLSTFVKTGDLYCLFYEKGASLLGENGVMCLITSNKWMRAGYGKPLRQFFLENGSILKILDFGDSRIFENATTYTNILLFCNRKNDKATISYDLNSVFEADTSLEAMLAKKGMSEPIFNENSFVIVKNEHLSIKKRVEEVGTPLKDWDIQISRGILTGLNAAFIIDGRKKAELISEDPKSTEIIKPILRGRDIKKYSANFADLWLINSHNGLKGKGIPRINVPGDYLAIYKHLRKFEEKLKDREDQGDHWTNLRNCAYLDELENNKIVYPDIMRLPVKASSYEGYPYFFLDKKSFCIEATNFLITGDGLPVIIAVLSSTLGVFAFTKFYAGPQFDEKGFRYKKEYLQNLPIPKLDIDKQKPFESLVDCILFAKENALAEEASTLESIIDVMVYGLYFEKEMKEASCYINDRVAEFIKTFKPEDTDEFKAEYIRSFTDFCRKNDAINHSLVHSQNVKPVEIIRKTLGSE